MDNSGPASGIEAGVDRRTLLAGAVLLTAVDGSAQAAIGGGRQRLIATEEGFALPETMAATNAWLEHHPGEEAPYRALRESFSPQTAIPWFKHLVDFGPVRAAAMDDAGIDTALLLHGSPGVQIFDAAEGTALAAMVNDRMAELSRREPRRYAPLATIAPQDPAAAVKEMDRAINRLGLHGVLINSHTKGEYLDDHKFWPIFEAAEAMGIAIYIHPREPSPAMAGPFLPYALSGAIWGYAAETGLHALRIIMSGAFDRFPRLQIALGHLGEGLPFFIDRIDIRNRVEISPNRLALKRQPSDYLRNNFHLTTSGMNWEPAVQQALQVMGPDRVQFAADWPFEDATDAARRFRAMTFDPATHARLSHLNAECLWRIPA